MQIIILSCFDHCWEFVIEELRTLTRFSDTQHSTGRGNFNMVRTINVTPPYRFSSLQRTVDNPFFWSWPTHKFIFPPICRICMSSRCSNWLSNCDHAWAKGISFIDRKRKAMFTPLPPRSLYRSKSCA
jgi:hypothetical protein